MFMKRAYLLVFLLVGCGRSATTTYPVSGKVLDANGKPAVNAMVMFHPVPANPDVKNPPIGRVDEQGDFRLTSFVKDDGAPPGDYVVTIEWRPLKKTPFSPEPDDLLAGRYRNPAKSTLRAKVNEAETSLPPFQVK